MAFCSGGRDRLSGDAGVLALGAAGPIDHPLAALATFSHQDFPFRTLFAGQYFPATDLPWTYLPVHILLALPELVLVLLVAAPFVALGLLRREFAPSAAAAFLAHFLLAFAILFPVGYAIAIKAVLFDGMRHFIFVLPLIAVVAALLAERGWQLIATFRGRAASPLPRSALYSAIHVVTMARLHPDEYIYYNGSSAASKARKASSSSITGRTPTPKRCMG